MDSKLLQVLETFESTVAQMVVLSVFVPLLIGTGGNTGNQAATTVTRAIALGDIKMGADILQRFYNVTTSPNQSPKNNPYPLSGINPVLSQGLAGFGCPERIFFPIIGHTKMAYW